MAIKFGSLVRKLISSRNTDFDNKNNGNGKKGSGSGSGGFVPVYIGEEHKRYEVPLKCINSYRFEAFLNQHEEDILAYRDEPITILCSTHVFETVLTLAKNDAKLLLSHSSSSSSTIHHR